MRHLALPLAGVACALYMAYVAVQPLLHSLRALAGA